jgi:protein-disulfide isomerase
MNRFAFGLGLICLVVAATSGFARADTPEESLAKYFRRKNNIPSQQKVAVQGMTDSTRFKGLKEGTISIGEGPGVKSVGFIASPDFKYVVYGDLVDTSVHPGKPVMDKINLKDEPASGAKDAKVTIVEYSDFQCPYCKKGYDTIEQQVLKQYDGKVKFYFKSFPLPMHPWAQPASIAAECAKIQKPDAYWKLYHSFFEHQAEVNPQNVKDKSTEYLKDSGIDMAKWNDCFDNKKTLDRVNAQQQEGAGIGVQGTPAFFINGRFLNGAMPFDRFKEIIDDELASAK